jgi:superfamily I DNA and/or RNA helicase
LYLTRKKLGTLTSLKAKDIGDVESRKLALRKQIVRKCDIVLATLSGSGHDLVSQLNGVDFMTVIIDEACQAVETSSLIPLLCGAVKCILIGDPMQLPPTVLSSQGVVKKFNQSLFERILKTVGSEFLLSVQYRMHPELALFPNKYFYKGKLSNAPYMKENRTAGWHNQKFPPFAFYDVHQGEEKQDTRSKSYYNMHEVECIIAFVKNLSKSFPNIMVVIFDTVFWQNRDYILLFETNREVRKTVCSGVWK